MLIGDDIFCFSSTARIGWPIERSAHFA